ncbi:sigma-70 family RNA polymerase sigma factor [Microvirga rosea]|uniref:sigma-70 family RNA polymerase sigma factor n=1 Tax=Microvirga rosea TaxID=2715425 RepID=UPI001D0A1847|nr:sigma-70 family RNA polymerase sigma factor [Microvirga rosea]MCB8820224.1 sigma-70 family RNA polymerase sigma factor [Microvirga rosea]
MPVETSIEKQMLSAIPHLRAFAVSLTGDLDRADDLVQGAVLTGIEKIDQFQPGTNLQAWLFTILRNQFRTDYRKRKREVEDPNGAWAEKSFTGPAQESRLDFEDMLEALSRLSVEQREAVWLVAAEGMSYEEAARVCQTNIGTIKSRINRARANLAKNLGIDDDEDLGPTRMIRATAMMETFF